MSTIAAIDSKPMDTNIAKEVEHFEVCDGSTTNRKGGQPSEEAWRTTEKRLVRKLDMTLMPMVWILYLFNYLDRNNIAYVKNRA